MGSPESAPLAATAARPARSHGVMHLIMLLVTVCWAVNIIAGKDALEGFSALALAQLRVLGTAVVYAAIYLACRKPLRLALTGRQWWFLALTALCGVTLNQIFFIGGVSLSTVSHTGLIVALGPVTVLALACLLKLEALTVPKLVGMLISFGGVGILTADQAGRGSGASLKGDLILLAGTLVFAVFTILVKEIVDRYDALTLNTLVFGLGALLMLPLGAPAVQRTAWSALRWDEWWGLGFMVLLGSVLPYLLFAYALSELTAARVAAFNYLQPVIASSLGIWLLAERLTVKVVMGGALILLGVYLTERERGEEKLPPKASAEPA